MSNYLNQIFAAYEDVHNHYLDIRIRQQRKGTVEVPLSVSLTTFKTLRKLPKYAHWKTLSLDMAKDAIRRADYVVTTLAAEPEQAERLTEGSDYFIYVPVKWVDGNTATAFKQTFKGAPAAKLVGIQMHRINGQFKPKKIYESR